ncbi:hypothetical protein AhyVDH1_046 [Aeromonas phage AhyVDH1]|nr:hypothetical protein AhyVDH1_046 [Aeromonas phage AhyVDH1]
MNRTTETNFRFECADLGSEFLDLMVARANQWTDPEAALYQMGFAYDNVEFSGPQITADEIKSVQSSMSAIADDLGSLGLTLATAGDNEMTTMTTAAQEWVYFVRNTAAETLRRYDASGLSDASQVMGVNGFQDSVLTATEAKQKIERGFARVVEAPQTKEEAAPAEWVYFQCKATSGWDLNIRRIRSAADVSDRSEALVNGSWEASRLTLGEMRTMIAFGSAEFVDAPKLKMAKPSAPEWVYFVNLGTTGTLRRYDANNPAAKSQYRAPGMDWEDSTLTGSGALQKLAEGAAALCNEFGSACQPAANPDESEATDPVTGFTYRVAKDGGIFSKPAGALSFCAAVCNVKTIQTLIRLGLVKGA